VVCAGSRRWFNHGRGSAGSGEQADRPGGVGAGAASETPGVRHGEDETASRHRRLNRLPGASAFPVHCSCCGCKRPSVSPHSTVHSGLRRSQFTILPDRLGRAPLWPWNSPHRPLVWIRVVHDRLHSGLFDRQHGVSKELGAAIEVQPPGTSRRTA